MPSRTSSQVTPNDKRPSPPEETGKTLELSPDTLAPRDELTTNQGVAVSDDQNSLKSHVRGPTLLEDILMREKITHFDHERIPERVVHARGAAAHGVFQVYESQAFHPCPRIPGARLPAGLHDRMRLAPGASFTYRRGRQYPLPPRGTCGHATGRSMVIGA
jgi:hypothetical protein